MANAFKVELGKRAKKGIFLGLGLSMALSGAAFGKGDHHAPATPQEQWEALATLQSGNKRFAEGKPDHSQQAESDRTKLVDGQNPPAIVLSCSDSRVPPEKIFDQGLGQVFTIRVAGHVASSDAIASIEYALEHLGSKLLVVLGHDSCGAVKAALTTPEGKSAGSPHLDGLIGKIRPSVSRYRSVASEDKTLRLPVKSNVTATVKDLIKRSKIVREYVEKEKLLIAQGVYSLATGKVDFWSVGQPIVVVEKEVQVRKPASAPEKAEPVPAKEEKETKPEAGWEKSNQWKKTEAGHGGH